MSNLRRVKFTLLLAISSQGIIDYQLLEHNCKKEDFIKFFKTLVIPKKTTIVMDNIRFHHSSEIKDISECKGWKLLYTPPYWIRQFSAVYCRFLQLNPSSRSTGHSRLLYRFSVIFRSINEVSPEIGDMSPTSVFEMSRCTNEVSPASGDMSSTSVPSMFR